MPSWITHLRNCKPTYTFKAPGGVQVALDQRAGEHQVDCAHGCGTYVTRSFQCPWCPDHLFDTSSGLRKHLSKCEQAAKQQYKLPDSAPSTTTTQLTTAATAMRQKRGRGKVRALPVVCVTDCVSTAISPPLNATNPTTTPPPPPPQTPQLTINRTRASCAGSTLSATRRRCARRPLTDVGGRALRR